MSSSSSTSSSSDEEIPTKSYKKQSSFKLENTKPIVITQVVKKPVRKGPYAIKHNLDPNAVIIQRRLGEGSKPIFDRDDVRVNPSPPRTPQKNSQYKKSISPRSTPEHYKKKSYSPKRKRTPEKVPYYSNPLREKDRVRTKFREENSYKKKSISPRLSLERNKGKSCSPKRKRTPEKVPYFSDPVREQDRLRAKYKKYRVEHSPVRSRHRSRSRSPASRNYRRRRSRSRSNSYHHSSSSTSHRHRRSSSRERHKRRRSRSRSRSHSASRSRSRRTPPHEQPPPQYIPVPTIPIPLEYAAAAPPARWIPAPMYHPRYPMMPRPPMYPHLMPYYPGLGPPMPPPPRFRGRPPPRPNYNNRS